VADRALTELLQSIVDLARASFGARASSILALDEKANELVFAAVAGEGSDSLVGRRIPSSTGIAGWVLVTREPLVVDDLARDPRFGREAAESTGYVPRAIAAVPLLRGDRVLGVLEVLDPAETNLLDLLAKQAAIALALDSAS
jgi:GAF domain-containing protein